MSCKTIFSDALKSIGRPEIDPAYVEGWMRLEYSTLGHLPRAVFVRFAHEVAALIDDGHEDAIRDNAKSYGLMRCA